MEPAIGIEPIFPHYERGVLPLNEAGWGTVEELNLLSVIRSHRAAFPRTVHWSPSSVSNRAIRGLQPRPSSRLVMDIGGNRRT